MKTQQNFSHLSLKDLIDIRDCYHLSLINKKNVLATAIGRYLIRKDDFDEHGQYRPADVKTKRTLENSFVTPISWPCILVFVSRWEDDQKLALTADGVQRYLTMEDGRTAPVCVVEAPTATGAPANVNFDMLHFPTNYMGGGFPVKVHSQNADYIATAGCIVSDGHTYYLLTNRHVSGDEGQEITTVMGDEPFHVGISTGVSLGKVPFSELYPEWESKKIKVNCDAGLVRLADITRWKTDFLGIDKTGPLYDLNCQTVDLDLIAQQEFKDGNFANSGNGLVSGFGAVSGLMKGEIKALFYRYQALGGVEYVSDFLIGGRGSDLLNTHRGDSGTVWTLEVTEETELEDQREDGMSGKPKMVEKTSYYPLALHWGEHQLIGDSQKMQLPLVMASNLTNICRDLDVEIVRGWNMADDYSWGKVGHTTVGYLATTQVANGNLKTFLGNNVDRISVPREKITGKLDEKDNPVFTKDPEKGFCALSDVPDIIWKQAKLNTAKGTGTKWGRLGDENPNHYADADQKTPDNKTLYDFCPDAKRLTVDNFIAYYDAIDKAANIDVSDPKNTGHRGLVCFRVWQIFDYMVEAAKKGDPGRQEFLFGAGVLAHYVGDGCQPLHGSYMSDGDPADDQTVDYVAKVTSKNHQKGDVYKKKINPGSGVHVAYEDHMIDDYIDKIMAGVDAKLQDQQSEALPKISNGQEAGFAVLQLMKLTQQQIAPKAIVEAFKAAKGQANISEKLYEQFGENTMSVIARGARYLAAIWDAAWKAGTIQKLDAVDKVALQNLYKDPANLQSYHLDTIKTHLK